jgi:putative zinc finger protein
MTCEETRRIASELALGIADGEERARALDHLAGCADCRRAVAELSEVTDALLLAAPEREPPVGFESRVLARLDTRPTAAARPRRWRRALLVLAPAAATAALATVAVLNATSDDRRLAGQYREALSAAHGTSFEAARLHAPGNRSAGVVYAYRGSPSWVFVYVYRGHRTERYRFELVTRSGRLVPVRSLRIDPATGSGGQAVGLDIGDIAGVRLVGTAPGDVLEADLPRPADRAG